jgi:hypothetical protein
MHDVVAIGEAGHRANATEETDCKRCRSSNVSVFALLERLNPLIRL